MSYCTRYLNVTIKEEADMKFGKRGSILLCIATAVLLTTSACSGGLLGGGMGSLLGGIFGGR